MDLANKAGLLSDHWLQYGESPVWQQYFSYNDLAMPYAFGYSFEHINEFSAAGEEILENAWKMLCDILGVDARADWQNLDQMFANANFGQEA